MLRMQQPTNLFDIVLSGWFQYYLQKHYAAHPAACRYELDEVCRRTYALAAYITVINKLNALNGNAVAAFLAQADNDNIKNYLINHQIIDATDITDNFPNDRLTANNQLRFMRFKSAYAGTSFGLYAPYGDYGYMDNISNDPYLCQAIATATHIYKRIGLARFEKWYAITKNWIKVTKDAVEIHFRFPAWNSAKENSIRSDLMDLAALEVKKKGFNKVNVYGDKQQDRIELYQALRAIGYRLQDIHMPTFQEKNVAELGLQEKIRTIANIDNRSGTNPEANFDAWWQQYLTIGLNTAKHNFTGFTLARLYYRLTNLPQHASSQQKAIVLYDIIKYTNRAQFSKGNKITPVMHINMNL